MYSPETGYLVALFSAVLYLVTREYCYPAATISVYMRNLDKIYLSYFSYDYYAALW